MRNTTRAAAIVGAVLVTLGAGAGLAYAGDKGHADACVVGPEQALINAPALNCADVDVSDTIDSTVSDVLDVDDTLNDLVDDLDLPILG